MLGSNGWNFALAVATIGLFGCAEAPSTSNASDGVPGEGRGIVRQDLLSAHAAGAHRRYLRARTDPVMEHLVRTVALALADDQLRAMVRSAVLESPFREHKVDFDQFISSTGGRLLDRVSALDARTSAAVLSELAEIFPLEMYFPIKGQLEAWQGDANLLVATQASDTSDPIIYNLRGERVTGIGPRQATTIPTLVLVRREGRYKLAGLPIAFTQVDCEVYPELCEGGGGGGGGVAPRGEWITSFETDDDFEGLFMGEPEFEITIVPTSNGIYDTSKYRCLGEAFPTYSPRYWDVDENVSWSGNAPILNFFEENEDNYLYVTYLVTENDDDGCQDEFPSLGNPDPLGNDDDSVATFYKDWNGSFRGFFLPNPLGHLLAFSTFRRYTFDPEP